MKLVIKVITLLFLLQSCVSSSVYIKDNSTEKVVFPFRTTEINIVDLRTDKKPMGWKLPVTSAKQREWIGNPELTEENKVILTNLIKQAENPNGKPVKLTLKLVDGTCKIYADWKQAKEYAKVKFELEVESVEENTIQTSHSEVFYEYNTLNALEKSVLSTYNIALRNATHRTLQLFSTGNTQL